MCQVRKKVLAYGRDVVVQNRVFISHIMGLTLPSIVCPIPDSSLFCLIISKDFFYCRKSPECVKYWEVSSGVQ
jgi:hypothetical protein